MDLYRYLDRSIDALPRTERAVVTAMRLWVTAARAGRCPCGGIAQVFGLPVPHDALAHFNMMMATLNHEGARIFRFAAVGTRRVSDDEAAILALYHAAARADEAGTLRMASTIVDPAGGRRLATALGLVAISLAALPHLSSNDQDR